MSSLIDASSAIHIWQHYPIKQFPKLWNWLAERMKEGHIQSITEIMTEIQHVEKDCHKWLKDQEITFVNIDDVIVQEALSIKNTLNIIEFSKHPKGVDETDVFLIATAKIKNKQLMSQEAVQITEPVLKKNYKIPLVCRLQNPAVRCISFIDFIKDDGAVF